MTALQPKPGLIMDEPLIWEKSRKGRCGFSIPRSDVKSYPVDKTLARDKNHNLPEVAEPDIVRHYTRLSTWNFGVDTGMYPLGSCTMKYNPKTNERQAGLRGFTDTHPLLAEIDPALCQGGLKLIFELEKLICTITGMAAVSLQPAAGAQGEFTGMQIIKAFHKFKNSKKNKIIVPDSAHGTNPASAVLCGFDFVSVSSDKNGILSVDEILRAADDDTAGIMITNPNTLGLFEENIVKISEIIHSKGGLVYCDGANLNALLGMVDIKKTGVDIMHINLHKTFSTPHGGGGPGSGPVCVVKELEKFLPAPVIVKKNSKYKLSYDNPLSIGRLHPFYGNFSILVRAYSYILSLGRENLSNVSRISILNANYIKERLKKHYHIAFDKTCMHECVFTDKYQQKNKVVTMDIIKRLMDYGIHPPTVYFPIIVNGAIMIEPTETESKETIDFFIDAMIEIADEIKKDGKTVLNAPHNLKVKRMDEILAARKPCLCG